MTTIKLPIFYDTSEINREELGLPPLSYDQCETRDVLFLNIDCMETTKEGHTIVYSSGEPWTTPLPISEVIRLTGL